MSDQIPEHMVRTYNSALRMRAQQKSSKLEQLVTVENDTGEMVSFDSIGAVAGMKSETRHGDVQYINTPHFRRWVFPEHWYVADLMDLADVRKLLNNPGGRYTRAQVMAMNRHKDMNIINGMLGNAYEGKNATTPIALPAGQKIAHGGTGFTLAKVEQAFSLLVEGHADEMDDDFMPAIAWTRKQEQEFLGTTEVKSVDYNTQRVLVDGTMSNGQKFYGFHYVRLQDWKDQDKNTHQILPKSGTVRTCTAWVKAAVVHNRWKVIGSKADQLPQKHYSWQFYTDAEHGTVRDYDEGVVQVDVQEP